MFILNAIKNTLKSYQHGALAPVIALLASIQQSLRYLSFIRIFVDKEGDWHNRRGQTTFVAPSLHAVSYAEVESYALGGWCYDYMLKDGDVVVDIGAGIGDDAIVFSRLVGPKGRIIAIEAHPRTFGCLAKTIKLNHLHNVVAVNVATSDEDGEIDIFDSENYLSSNTVNGQKGKSVAVKASRLDDILRDLRIPNPQLIKINIEGAETATLRGAEETLRVTPRIVVSCHDFISDGGGDPVFRTYNECRTILLDAGYSLRERRDDHQPWFAYYLYGSKCGDFEGSDSPPRHNSFRRDRAQNPGDCKDGKKLVA
jgi:FkbM family methyltransferase